MATKVLGKESLIENDPVDYQQMGILEGFDIGEDIKCSKQNKTQRLKEEKEIHEQNTHKGQADETLRYDVLILLNMLILRSIDHMINVINIK